MPDRFVATNGYDGNSGASISNAYGSLEAAMNDSLIGAGDTIWMVVANPGDKFTSETGTITADIVGNDTSGGVNVRATNASGVVDGTMAIIDFSGISVTNGGVNITTSGWFFQNISIENVVSGTNQDGWRLQSGLQTAPLSGAEDYGYATFLGCAARNNGADGFISNHRFPLFIQCYSANNSSDGFSNFTQGNHYYYGCVSEDNVDHGYNLNSNGSCFFCIGNNNGGSGILSAVHVINCTFDGNSVDGISFNTEADSHIVANNILSNNGAFGINNTQASDPEGKVFLNNAFYNNTSGQFEKSRVYWEFESGTITLTQTPYKNRDYRDFSLNSLPNGGQLCRSAANNFLAKIPKTLSFLDIGALQTPLRGIVVG